VGGERIRNRVGKSREVLFRGEKDACKSGERHGLRLGDSAGASLVPKERLQRPRIRPAHNRTKDWARKL